MGSRRNATNARWNTRREGGGPEGLSPPTDSGFSLDDDRKAEIEATFKRIHRPLRWPMENFRRRYISNKGFVGYRFSRIRRNAHAGFSFGFALREGLYPGIREPPEVETRVRVAPDPGEPISHETLVRDVPAAKILHRPSERSMNPFERRLDFRHPVVVQRESGVRRRR